MSSIGSGGVCFYQKRGGQTSIIVSVLDLCFRVFFGLEMVKGLFFFSFYRTKKKLLVPNRQVPVLVTPLLLFCVFPRPRRRRCTPTQTHATRFFFVLLDVFVVDFCR